MPSPAGNALDSVWSFLDFSSTSERGKARREKASPSDSLIIFAAMWGMAMLFSGASHSAILMGLKGRAPQILDLIVMANALYVMWKPSRLGALVSLSSAMCLVYFMRVPVSSNNQTIALYMNLSIIAVVGFTSPVAGAGRHTLIYERLRFVAKSLLAIMYFYGIFHKINSDFINPSVSCATELYIPLTRPLGLGDSDVGRYLAIYSTFLVEAVAIVCLYVRRLFWLGLVLSLPFHYVIPISAYSWYMDFSSLVFALYMLSMPRASATSLYTSMASFIRHVTQLRPGAAGLVAFGATLITGAAFATYLSLSFSGRPAYILWHSAWLVAWAVLGGAAMIFIIRAALVSMAHWEFSPVRPRPWWLYGIPVVLFVSCWSPYIGLKTESSIAMFSNLHTEGGSTNHLLFSTPPYLFPYQQKTARIIDSSSEKLRRQGASGNYLVEHDLALRIIGNPKEWVTYVIDGKTYHHVTAATYTGYRPNWIETKLLDFKPVDWDRPKKCTH
jgi:hypothetical protein